MRFNWNYVSVILLKGVLAKMKWYRLTSKNIRWWSSIFFNAWYFIIFSVCFIYNALKTTIFFLCHVEPGRHIKSRNIWRPTNRHLNWIIFKTNKEYYGLFIIYECVEKKSMIIGCNIWKICLELDLLQNSDLYGISLV